MNDCSIRNYYCFCCSIFSFLVSVGIISFLFGGAPEKSQLRLDRLGLTKTFFEFFYKYNPRYDEGGAYFPTVRESRRTPVLVTGRQWY